MESSGSHQRLYELLGAPSLLYRHAPSYTNPPVAPPERQKAVQEEARYIHNKHRAFNRVKTRWYYSVDHPFRPFNGENGDERFRRRKKRRKETNSDDQADPESPRSAMLRVLNETDPFQQESVLYSSSKDLEAARLSILPYDPEAKVRHVYDQSYVPGRFNVRFRSMTPSLPPPRLEMSRIMAKERMDADLAYLAPVDISSIRYALQEGDDGEGIRRKRPTRSPVETTHDHPSSYGNCLVCVPSPESNKTKEAGQSKRSTRWCLVHPTGEILSRVRASNLVLPRSTADDGNSGGRREQQGNNELDVGEPIRQILQCGEWGPKPSLDNDNNINEPVGMFVARSTSYCTVFSIRVSSGSQHERQNDKTSTGHATDSSTGTPINRYCSGQYNLEEVSRVDLRSLNPSEPSHYPLDVACHPNYGNAYTDSKLAILSHCRSRGESNVIHHVVVRDSPVVRQHKISNLKAIAEIDFTNSHPMTLWASARSYVRPALTRRFQQGRPLLGHGNSLYTIDLRSNNAVFQWSPSAEDLLPEGIHSVSGIRTDWQKQHAVWVTSSSAAKTWEIDGRMPCRAVNTWSLANVCDDWGAVVPSTGLYGAGTLLTQPVSVEQDLPRPLLSVCKRPGSFGIHLYQRPNYLPRFQTKSLESSTVSLSQRQDASCCTSSIFALPDVSDSTFTCGMAAIRTPITDVLQNVGQLGYEHDPTDALCVVTMTNKGDLYAHTMLDCHPNEKEKSHHFADLPLGCAAVPIPKQDQDKIPAKNTSLRYKNDGHIRVCLSNTFPVASNAIVPQTVKDRADCLPFATIRMEQLPTYSNNSRTASNSSHGEKGQTEMESPEESHAQAELKKTSVQHPTCDIGLGSVMTGSNNTVGLEASNRRSKLKLAPQHIAAAHKRLEKFGECFQNSRTSVVEEMSSDSDEEIRKTRSDVSKEVLAVTGTLWNEHGRFNEHVAIKKEGGLETDDTEDLQSFTI